MFMINELHAHVCSLSVSKAVLYQTVTTVLVIHKLKPPVAVSAKFHSPSLFFLPIPELLKMVVDEFSIEQAVARLRFNFRVVNVAE